jgi:hypothetical protein
MVVRDRVRATDTDVQGTDDGRSLAQRTASGQARQISFGDLDDGGNGSDSSKTPTRQCSANDDDTDSECPVCFEPYNLILCLPYEVNPCGHPICKVCVLAGCLSKGICPTCSGTLDEIRPSRPNSTAISFMKKLEHGP